jgi:hypothetical protein
VSIRCVLVGIVTSRCRRALAAPDKTGETERHGLCNQSVIMKLSKTFLGTALVVLFSAQIGCGGADASADPSAGSSESDLTKRSSSVKFADFESDAVDIANSMSDGPDCSFTSSTSGGKLTLTVTNGKDSTEIVTSSSDTIALSKKDGGSTRIYKISGVGTLTIVEADDAFISAEISTSKKSTTCEIDF